MSDHQQRKARILQRLVDNSLTGPEAAQLLGKSVRQVRRMKDAFQVKGMASVIHGNKGRSPANKTPEDVRKKLCELAGPNGAYKDYNTCHLAEVLARKHEITLGRATLDRLLISEGLRKRQKPGEHVRRKRRKRRSCEGTVLQIDGSDTRAGFSRAGNE